MVARHELADLKCHVTCPVCRVNVPETLSHMYLYCSAYAVPRTQFLLEMLEEAQFLALAVHPDQRDGAILDLLLGGQVDGFTLCGWRPQGPPPHLTVDSPDSSELASRSSNSRTSSSSTRSRSLVDHFSSSSDSSNYDSASARSRSLSDSSLESQAGGPLQVQVGPVIVLPRANTQGVPLSRDCLHKIVSFSGRMGLLRNQVLRRQPNLKKIPHH